jgi:hypothetical protein
MLENAAMFISQQRLKSKEGEMRGISRKTSILIPVFHPQSSTE